MRPLVALFLISCGLPQPTLPEPVALFESPCGLKYMGDWGSGEANPGMTAERLEAYEAMALKHFPEASDVRFQGDLCEAFRGTLLYSHPEGCWDVPTLTTLKVCGLAGGGVVEFDLKGDTSAALLHELAHVVQFHSSPYGALQPPSNGWDEAHANWTRDGIDRAISNGYFDLVALFTLRGWKK